MSALPFMEDIAIRSGGGQLLLPPGLGPGEIASVVARKAEILAELRVRQTTPAGFLARLPGALLGELRAAPWLALDLETTGLTRFSEPQRVTKSATVGRGTWTTYRAAFPEAALDVRPRARVLTVRNEPLGTYAWDLDALPAPERLQLFDAALRGKILVGHNAAFDLSWLFGETEARPRILLDTMLLARQIRPGILLRLFGRAVDGDRDGRKLAIEMIRAKQGKASAALDYVAACLGMPVPDKTWQKPANWCVTPLSPEHLAYVRGDVDLPLRILRFLLPGVAVEEMPARIELKHPWCVPYGAATIRLAEAHARGVPFDRRAADEIQARSLVEIDRAADELLRFPEYAAIPRETLAAPRSGEARSMKQALAAHAEAHGMLLPKTGKGDICTDRKSLAISGAVKLPAWPAYERLKAAKKAMAAAGEYKRAAALDGRLHSLVSCNTATGRMSSSEPNLQNVPRDPRFRELVRARAGHLILAADYAAIELRIAAALAERAIDDIRGRIERGDAAGWFMRRVWVGHLATERLSCPPEPEPMWTLQWLQEAIPATAQEVLRRGEQSMASIFRRKLDPHLATAVDLARRAGRIDTGGLDSVEWLASLGADARSAVEARLKRERQSAKPVNFGLLYGRSAVGLHGSGVSDYDLAWTLDEAARARDAWFALYPEFRLWHFWTKYMRSRKIQAHRCALWNPRKRKLARPARKPYLYEPATLAGRPFAILDGFREARNYQDQGTGADILVRAVAALPEDAASMLLMPVHDELVFEVPANMIEEVGRAVAETMIRAAEAVLGGIVPVDVKVSVGDAWGKPEIALEPLAQGWPG